MNTVGEILKEERNFKNISIFQVSQELKISKFFLEKLENDEVVQDYNVVFYIGHLRSYCKFLGLDENLLISNFKTQISFKKNDISDKIVKPNFDGNFLLFNKVYPVSIIIIIFTSFYFLFIKEKNQPQEYALVPDLPESYIPIIEKAELIVIEEKLNKKDTAMELKNESFSNSSVIASDNIIQSDINDTITLRLLNPTWIQIRDSSNEIILSKMMDKDEEFKYDLKLYYNITSGNAGNILVLINEKVRGKIGKFGEIIDSFIVDKSFNN